MLLPISIHSHPFIYLPTILTACSHHPPTILPFTFHPPPIHLPTILSPILPSLLLPTHTLITPLIASLPSCLSFHIAFIEGLLWDAVDIGDAIMNMAQRPFFQRGADMEAICCPSIILWMKSHPGSQHRKPINPRYPRGPKGQVYKPQIELDAPILCIRKQVHPTRSHSTGVGR